MGLLNQQWVCNRFLCCSLHEDVESASVQAALSMIKDTACTAVSHFDIMEDGKDAPG